MKNIIITAGLFVITSCGTSSIDTAKMEALAQMVESRNYVFVAEYAYPMNGRSIYLTSEYTFAVSQDTITAYLPYFGRAYVAPIDPDEGGIQFKSNNFRYDITKKKNNWEVMIKTKSVQRNYQISLNIGTTGNATLNITSNDRQSISFNGYIDKGK
ncbi:MAG: DUF4251 domain-containing protein [Candidatus Azobacteroides sp.]|nr:DUF4251 domain-containing protein [Candidatus Azobacteroides sp.]